MKQNAKGDSSLNGKEYLGLTVAELNAIGGVFTAKEISQQPTLWLDTYKVLKEQQTKVDAFLNEVYKNKDINIILTGAGTSAFIGNILQGPFQNNLKKRTWAVATTDLVSHPQQYFYSDTPTLLVSFARSGNSPESVAAVNLADKLCKNVYHLIITCNPEGRLAKEAQKDRTYVFLLPPEADDQSLAMTGSFSSMLLTGLLISRLHILDELKKQVDLLAAYGSKILNRYTPQLKEIATLNFQRAVFLGSGPLLGAARESHLKLQELTDGRIICKEDSFLGFRHGPKAVINSSTLLVYLFSNNEYVSQYEVDLVNTINAGEKGLFSIGISETPKNEVELDLNIVLSSAGSNQLDEEFLAVCSVLPAQIIGFFKSIQQGLKPDSPSVKGTITRVVQGVNIYPYERMPEPVKVV